jgi:hypothetical protein
MKHFLTIATALVMILGSLSLNAQTIASSKSSVEVKSAPTKVEVLYFHYTRRCVTCKTVEENSKIAVDQLNSEKKLEYSFKALNMDDADTKPVAQKNKVEGQALVVVVDGQVTDITGASFMNAKDLSKIKEEIKKAVDKALVKK